MTLRVQRLQHTASGWRSAMRSRAGAVPSGRRWPCSQFCRVRGLMPMSAANWLWLRASFSRTACASGQWSLVLREGFVFPRRMAPPSLRLVTSCWKSPSFNCIPGTLQVALPLQPRCHDFQVHDPPRPHRSRCHLLFWQQGRGRRVSGRVGVPPAVLCVSRSTRRTFTGVLIASAVRVYSAGREIRQAGRPPHPRHTACVVVRFVIPEKVSHAISMARPMSVSAAFSVSVFRAWTVSSGSSIRTVEPTFAMSDTPTA